MCRKLIFMLLVFAFGLATSAEAITIIWVGDNSDQDTVVPGKAADQGWVDLLRLEGYTVDYRGEDENDDDYRYWRSLNDGKIAELEAADLIIFSRGNSSGQYNDDPEQGQWNSLSTPIIIQIAHIARTNNRLSWLNSPDTSRAHSPLEAVDPAHPIFEGINFGANNQVDILLPGLGVDFVSTTNPGNGKMLAKRNNDQVWIATWDAGQDYFDGGPYTAGGRRMFFAAGSTDSEDGEYNFNAQGTKMFLNAVKYFTGAVYIATNPNPKNGPRTAPTGDEGEGHWMAMTFDKGHGATTHTAYFSENFDYVNERNGDALLGSPPYYPDEEDYETYYYVGKNDPCYPIPEFARTPLERGTTYYWVVDESNAVASYPGEVWSFTIATLAAWGPTPADDAININDTGVNLAWQKGGVDAPTIRYDVYWGTDEEMVAGRSDTPDAQVTDPTTTTPIGPLTVDMDYYWKVNTVVIPPSPPSLTIEGEVWHFKTKPVFPFTDDPNLIGWWTFDEVSGELALDHSGNANDGTITGGAQRVPGKIDKAIDVDGDNGKGVEIEFTTGWPVANPPELSVAMWVKPHVIDSDDDDTIFFMDEIDGNSKMRCRIHNGDWQFRHGNGTEAGNINSTGPPAILNEWTHYVGMRRDNDALYLYINGQFEDDSDFGASGVVDPMNCWIGAGDDGLGNPNNAFDGLIDDVRLYNRALSASEVAHLVDPALAYGPSPGEGEQDVPLSAKLTWTPGTDQSTGSPYAKHDVYFGTNFDAVDSATTPEATLTGDVNEHPVVLAYGTDYYWRIDGVNAGGGAYKGAVWTFKTMYNPAFARDPDPNDGTTGVPRNAVLSWTPGDYAPPSNGHYVYFGADDPANMALVPSQPQSPNNYNPGALNLGTTYYWAVDEANAAAPGGVDPGKIWSFTTIEHLVVDDMESYGDGLTPGEPGNCIFFVWRDGWTLNEADGFPAGFLSNNTGASIGNWDPPYAETTIVSGGGQSMPYFYDNDSEVHGGNNPANTANPNNPLEYYSKAKAEISDLQPLTQIGPDWTAGGAKALSLQFYGSTTNAIESMWLELTDGAGGNATVTYGDYAHENPADINEASWHEWNIDLQDFADGGVDLTNVSSIAIGFGSPTATSPGGSGVVYFDDIRLYPSRCVLAKRDPNFALLDYVADCVVNYRELEAMTQDWLLSESDVSADATLMNFPTDNSQWVAGKKSNALNFDGSNDYVRAEHVAIPQSAFTISLWISPDVELGPTTGRMDLLYWGVNARPHLTFNKTQGPDGAIGLWPNVGAGDFDGPMTFTTLWSANTWYHIAATFDGTSFKIYANGILEGTINNPGTHNSASDARIGSNAGGGNNFDGRIDDFRFYDYALSAGDVANLANEIAEPAVGPLYWYKFDETAGQTAQDAAGTVIHVPLPRPEIDLFADGLVNFKDFAVLAASWLDEGLFPPPSGR